MAFSNIMDRIRETADEEQARLAQSPAGSINHGCSLLPVKITGNVEGMIIKLPSLPLAPDSSPEGRATDAGQTSGTVEPRQVIVVPVEASKSTAEKLADGRMRRHDLYWTCIVVASNERAYPVAGYKLSIPEFELVRGTQLSVEAEL